MRPGRLGIDQKDIRSFEFFELEEEPEREWAMMRLWAEPLLVGELADTHAAADAAAAQLTRETNHGIGGGGGGEGEEGPHAPVGLPPPLVRRPRVGLRRGELP